MAGTSEWETNKAKEKIEKADDWLPVTSSRNAKWWYSAFHNVTAMVGAGVLSLPSAMTWLGWCDSSGAFLGNYFIHTLADGGDA